MENKNSYGWLIGLIIGILIGGIVVYLTMNNTKENPKPNSNSPIEKDVNDNNEVKDNNLEKVIIPDELSISSIGANLWDEKQGDIFANVDNRLKLVDQLVDSKDSNEPDRQSSAYASYEQYKMKYQFIFGDNYDFEQDTKKADSILYNDCSDISDTTVKNGNNICWNPAFGGAEDTLYTINKETKEDNKYVVKGTYNHGKEEGTFEVVYIINKDNNVNLKSLTLNCTESCLYN